MSFEYLWHATNTILCLRIFDAIFDVLETTSDLIVSPSFKEQFWDNSYPLVSEREVEM